MPKKKKNPRQEAKQMKEKLKGLEYCPTCGHKLIRAKKKMTEKQKEANRANGRKGGRPKKEE